MNARLPFRTSRRRVSLLLQRHVDAFAFGAFLDQRRDAHRSLADPDGIEMFRP